MSARELDDREFELLLTAHADRRLSAAQRQRLDELSEGRPERRAAVAGFAAVHGAFTTERALRREVMSGPSQPGEAADPTYRRMERAAATASAQLAAALRGNSAPASEDPAATGPRGAEQPPSRVGRSRRKIWIFAAAAAALVAALGLALQSGAGRTWPTLDPDRPDDRRLGGGPAHILFDAELRREDPVLGWMRQTNARGYEVVVEDAATGVEILRRDAAFAASNEWRLTAAEFETLAAHSGPAVLRIVARDGAGIVVGTSGDRPLTLR